MKQHMNAAIHMSSPWYYHVTHHPQQLETCSGERGRVTPTRVPQEDAGAHCVDLCYDGRLPDLTSDEYITDLVDDESATCLATQAPSFVPDSPHAEEVVHLTHDSMRSRPVQSNLRDGGRRHATDGTERMNNDMSFESTADAAARRHLSGHTPSSDGSSDYDCAFTHRSRPEVVDRPVQLVGRSAGNGGRKRVGGMVRRQEFMLGETLYGSRDAPSPSSSVSCVYGSQRCVASSRTKGANRKMSWKKIETVWPRTEGYRCMSQRHGTSWLVVWRISRHTQTWSMIAALKVRKDVPCGLRLV